MKLINQGIFLFCSSLLSLPAVGEICPFSESSSEPQWVQSIEMEKNMILGVGVEKYNSKIHSDFFSFRQQSEIRAKKSISENLSSSIYNSILSDKSTSSGQLLKNAQSVVKQVTEMTLPDTQVTGRWLDKKHCLLWTKISLDTEVVGEYIDEVGDMEKEVLHNLDNSLAKSVVEALNAKQFYLNYSGFTKALSLSAMLTYNGVTKPVLSWMIDNGFDMLEPSLGENSGYPPSMRVLHNLSSFQSLLSNDKLTLQNMKYILLSYEKSKQSAQSLKTLIRQSEGIKNVYANKNEGIHFAWSAASRLDIPFALGLRFTKEQPYWDVPRVTNTYENKLILSTGQYSLLHLVTLYDQVELVELLLKSGFDPNVKDINNMSPAQYAVAMEKERMIKLYLNSSKQLDGIYAIAVQKMIYLSSRYLYLKNWMDYTLQAQFTMFGMDYKTNLLQKYKNILKKKDKKNVKEYQALLKQSINALNLFNKNEKYLSSVAPKITKENFNENINRLKKMM